MVKSGRKFRPFLLINGVRSCWRCLVYLSFSAFRKVWRIKPGMYLMNRLACSHGFNMKHLALPSNLRQTRVQTQAQGPKSFDLGDAIL